MMITQSPRQGVVGRRVIQSLNHEILSSKISMPRKLIIVHIFLHTLRKTLIWGYHQQSTVTTFKRIIRSQYSLMVK